MIIQLHHQEREIAEQIRNVQIPAYRVEAEIIGFDGIPALRETVEQLMQSTETFYGYLEGEELLGAIACEQDEPGGQGASQVDITRLVVHPDHFRKGIAGMLLHYVFTLHGDAERFVVHTGAKNRPAIQLYEKYGFALIGEREVAPNFYLAELVKGGASQ